MYIQNFWNFFLASAHGEWEAWVKFFLRAIVESAKMAAHAA